MTAPGGLRQLWLAAMVFKCRSVTWCWISVVLLSCGPAEPAEFGEIPANGGTSGSGASGASSGGNPEPRERPAPAEEAAAALA